MDAREYKIRGIVVLELKGRVDEFNTTVLSDEFATILNTGRFLIVVDLAKTTFLSAHCLRAMWQNQKRARSLGGDIVLTCAHGQVLETIHYVNFDKVARRFLSNDEAIAYLESLPPKQRDKAPIQSQTEENPESIEPRWLKKLQAFFLTSLLGLLAMPAPQQAKAVTNTETNTEMSTDSKEEAKSRNTYTLDEVLSLARETSSAVKLARLKMAEKEAEVRIARSISLPKIIGTGGYLYQSNPNVLSDVVNREINNVRQTEEKTPDQFQARTRVNFDKDAMILGVGFSQIVYSGGLFVNQIALKEAQSREANAQVAIESLAIEEQVRNLFLGLLLTREKLKLLSANKDAVTQRLAAGRRALGMRTMSALQFAEIELLSLKTDQDILTAEKDEQSLRGLLNIVLNRPIESELTPLPTTIKGDLKLETPDHYFEIALHRYPELRRTMALMDSASAYEGIVRSQNTFSPQALIFGSTEYSYGLGSVKQDVSWSLGFGVYVPLYDGRKSSAEMEKAISLSSQARIAYQESEQKLRVEINDVVSEIRKAQMQYEISRKALEIAEKKRHEATEAVKQGQLPQYRLGDALTQELEVKIAIISAQAEYFKWRSRLLLLTGQRDL